MTPSEHPLGQPIRAFKAGGGARVVAALAGIVLALLGAFLIVRDWSDGIVSSIGWITVPPGLFAIALAFFLGQSSYLVCPDGVIRVRSGRRVLCRWSDVAEIIDLKFEQGMVAARRCVLVLKNGARLEIPDIGMADFPALLDLIRQQSAPHGVPWKEEQRRNSP